MTADQLQLNSKKGGSRSVTTKQQERVAADQLQLNSKKGWQQFSYNQPARKGGSSSVKISYNQTARKGDSSSAKISYNQTARKGDSSEVRNTGMGNIRPGSRRGAYHKNRELKAILRPTEKDTRIR